jgi:NDP-sugar pyrophosphorylase family protein
LNIIITLAGYSKRFFEKGYDKPKYLLPLGKSTVIENVLNQFNDNDNFHLILSRSQIEKYEQILPYLKNIKKNVSFYIIEDHKLGPIQSVLKAGIKDFKGGFVIAYNDFLVSWDYEKFKRLVYGYDGAIVSFSNFQPSSYTGTLYCYLKVKNNEVINLREKKSFTKNPEKEIASAGIYYFDDFEEFKYYANKLIKNKNNLIKNETYVSQVFVPMMKSKKRILDFRCSNFISLGTPKDYELFVFWKKYFQTNEL